MPESTTFVLIISFSKSLFLKSSINNKKQKKSPLIPIKLVVIVKLRKEIKWVWAMTPTLESLNGPIAFQQNDKVDHLRVEEDKQRERDKKNKNNKNKKACVTKSQCQWYWYGVILFHLLLGTPNSPFCPFHR